uniref:Ribonuclease kappa n=1 Tax=Globodera rostochiensis TaxID=31243 RepID=A0A914IA85_GLORO
MKKICPLCGPKLSAFCMIMSVWGIVFLGLLDLHFEEGAKLEVQAVEEKYEEKAKQCWIAAGMYVVTLIAVFWQNRFNTTQIL